MKDIRRSKGTYLRVALTRDLVRKFLSLHGNRVVAKRDLGIDAIDAQNVLDAGLSLNPQLGEFIDSLDGYLAASRTLSHHARSQIQFLGADLTVYDHLPDISEANRLIDLIRLHWSKRGLIQALSNADKKLPRLQTSGPKIGLDGISLRSFESVLNFYQPDYDAIPSLNQESIKAQFIRENGGTNLFLFDFSEIQKRKVNPVRQINSVVDTSNEGDLPVTRILRPSIKTTAWACVKVFDC